jgi:type I restriction enzyme S subunit
MDIQGLKDKILQLAIQGKLVEQDKNDEPASVLLQRIKEERDKLVKEKKIKKPKPLPEITDKEKPFEIPESWEWVRLGEVSIIQEGPGIRTFQYKTKGVQFLTVTNILEGNVDFKKSQKYISEEEYLKKYTHFTLNRGDIVTACSGASWGKSAIYNSDYRMILNTSTLRLRFYGDLSDNNYLYYLTKSTFFKKQIESQLVGMQPNFGYTHYSKVILPLPPLAEQKRIVEKVDELFALIDELDSNKEDLLEVINLTRNQVLQEAIQGKLVEQNPEDEPASLLLERIKEERDKLVKEGKIKKQKPLPEITDEEKPFEIPESWEWVRLGEVGSIVGGGTPKTAVKEYWEGGTIPWLTPADLSNYTDKYISRGKRNITPLGLKESSAQLMPKGTVLFSSRAPIGYTVIAQNEISTNQGFKSCIPFIIDMNEYLYYYLIYSAKLINENASGTTFKEVSGTEVSKLILPLPPLAEQKRIVEKVDMMMEILDKLENELTTKI